MCCRQKTLHPPFETSSAMSIKTTPCCNKSKSIFLQMANIFTICNNNKRIVWNIFMVIQETRRSRRDVHTQTLTNVVHESSFWLSKFQFGVFCRYYVDWYNREIYILVLLCARRCSLVVCLIRGCSAQFCLKTFNCSRQRIYKRSMAVNLDLLSNILPMPAWYH